MGHQSMTLSASDQQVPWAAHATAMYKHRYLLSEFSLPLSASTHVGRVVVVLNPV